MAAPWDRDVSPGFRGVRLIASGKVVGHETVDTPRARLPVRLSIGIVVGALLRDGCRDAFRSASDPTGPRHQPSDGLWDRDVAMRRDSGRVSIQPGFARGVGPAGLLRRGIDGAPFVRHAPRGFDLARLLVRTMEPIVARIAGRRRADLA